MSDSATDSAVTEKERVYVFVDPDDFEVITCLFSLQSLGSEDAMQIFCHKNSL